MKQERVDRLIDILPDFDELDPVFDHILATSRPDPGRTWSASGEVGTVGARLVDTESLEAATDEMAERAREHLAGLYRNVARVARALERGEREAAARILVEIAELEEDADRVDRAEAYALAAVEVARELRDRRPVALALRRAGRAARARGRLESALERYREAWEIGRVVGPVRDAAEAAIGAGNV
ncbi:MAG: tetratricopeptide repeat protein, partial [Longimicrobiales bacterium]